MSQRGLCSLESRRAKKHRLSSLSVTQHNAILTLNDSQVKLLPAEEFDQRGNDVRMQWGVRHISREQRNSLQLHSVIYVSFHLIPRKRVYCASIWIHSFWRCVPAISSVGIVSVSPLLTAERTNNMSGWKLNRFPLIAGSCGMPPTKLRRR